MLGYDVVEIQKITVPDGRRRINTAKVEAMAASIREIGLLEPIGVTPGYELIFGLHRLAAYEKLGRKKIPVKIVDLDGLCRELAEIDENLMRSALSAAEEAKAISRRKKIYEALHPNTKAGRSQAAGANRAQGNNVSDKMSPTFTADTASKTGKSRRSVERAAKLGKALDAAAVKVLATTPQANNRKELHKIAELPAKTQQQVAKKLADGHSNSVEEALGKPPADVQQRAATKGLRALKTVVAALATLGLDVACEPHLRPIKLALQQRANGGAKLENASKTLPAAKTNGVGRANVVAKTLRTSEADTATKPKAAAKTNNIAGNSTKPDSVAEAHEASESLVAHKPTGRTKTHGTSNPTPERSTEQHSWEL